MATAQESSFLRRLADALPFALRFTVYHVSSPPTPCAAIFPPELDEDEEPTQCESHFLSLSIDVHNTKIQAFAVEVLVYTTNSLTTLFVSKADSTGYLYLLNIPAGTSSPLRTIISTFLSYLVDSKKRNGIRLILSLFARAQAQYLFPGSIENPQKHVLDDRALIKWWCKILDGVLRHFPAERSATYTLENFATDAQSHFTATGYLRVPSCDTHETRAFLPSTARADSTCHPRWKTTDPLRELGKAPAVPERSLIPRFPDDPKARFVIDLDDELLDNSSQQTLNSPSKSRERGKWRSVKSLEQFWEMMAFRQECAAGRLVGFVWALFTPLGLLQRPFDARLEGDDSAAKNTDPVLSTPMQSQVEDAVPTACESPLPSSNPLPALPFSPAASSQLTLEPDPSSPVQAPIALCSEGSEVLYQTTSHPAHKTSSASNDVGEISLSNCAYSRCLALLERLDYANQVLAADSAQKWVSAVEQEAGIQEWGVDVVGTKRLRMDNATDGMNKSIDNREGRTLNGESNGIAFLSAGLVRKKKRPAEDEVEVVNGITSGEGRVKMLGAGLVRKKPKSVSTGN